MKKRANETVVVDDTRAHFYKAINCCWFYGPRLIKTQLDQQWWYDMMMGWLWAPFDLRSALVDRLQWLLKPIKS